MLTAGELLLGIPGSFRAPNETVLPDHTPNGSLNPTKMNAARMQVMLRGQATFVSMGDAGAFAAVKVKDVKQWVSDNLGGTLTSKRLATYQEFRAATKLATKTIAMT